MDRNTTGGLGLRAGTLALMPSDPRWPRAFALLRDALLSRLPDGAILHHIGSTAVPGLDAKPILDLALSAPADLHDRIAPTLTVCGWQHRGPRSGELFIKIRDADLRTHNLHLYAPDAPELAAQLAFRDRLRSDPVLRQSYGNRKHALIANGTPRGGYAAAKGPFIAAALA